MSRPAVDSLLAWLCPYRCIFCSEPADGMDLCAGCRADLPWQQHACELCAIPLAAAAARGTLCPRCSVKPPVSSACFTAFIYEYPLDRLITAMKFRRQTCMARVAGELLATYLQQAGATARHRYPDLLVPVPLHLKRCRERGYNQAELLAETLSQKLRLPCDPDLLMRSRPTASQSRLNRSQRLKNLRGAFVAQRPVTGMRIALVDDVITTGATAAACVKELHQKGAADVQIWAVARAIREVEKYN